MEDADPASPGERMSGGGQRPWARTPAAGSSPAAGPAFGDDRGSRAFGLGSHRRAVVAAAVGAVALLPAVLLAASPRESHGAPPAHAQRAGYTTRAGTSPSSAAASTTTTTAKYGGLPSWLPKAKTAVNRVVTATAAHPALAIQGDTVSVDLSGGRVLTTAVGPETPEQGRFPVPASSPCTFIVTFAHASGAIPLNARAFTFIDERGHVRHPRVTAMGGGAPPAKILPGRPVSLKVYDVLPTGDGGLTWAPDGGRPIASWDFDVEID
jgi:hypothetical protein